MALAVALAGSPQRHALVDGHVAGHDGGLTDHHSCCVIDEQPPAQQRAGMNIHSGEEAGYLGKYSCRQAQFYAPQKVRNAVKPYRPQPRIAEQNLQTRARGRVALQYGVNVFANAGEQFHVKWGLAITLADAES